MSLPGPAELVRAYGRPAKKSYGQHFLVDPGILDRVVHVAGVGAAARVLEIGPGPGGLTTRLLETGCDLTVLEADPELAEHLRAALGHVPNLTIAQGDALTEALDGALGEPPRDVVSNLPYGVATEILFRLVDRPDPPAAMTLMFQREVADRIVVDGGDRAFGPLAVGTGLLYERRIVMKLPPGAFVPAPRVHSAVVRFELREVPFGDADLRQTARTVARTAFGQRRKMLRKSLRGMHADPIAWCEAVGIRPDARPEALYLQDFIRLAEWITRERPR